jgi:pyruvate dehydrogenase E1 component beta subunit
MRKLAYINAIAEAQKEEMARDSTVFVVGEDVDLFGGVFKATAGIAESFATQKLFGAPISESAFTGLAAGAALTGLRPVVEFMYFDFIAVAMDQVVNQIAKLRHMSGGQVPKMPIVMRAQAGIGTCEAAQHSQSLEAWFIHVPGIKVVMPAGVYDAKGLLKSAIRDDNPVLYIENRNLYYQEEEVPDGEWLVALGLADVVRTGTDVTVVALGYARRSVLKALDLIAGKNISVELIDPRTLHPLDLETILNSLRKTGKIMVVHEAPARCGVGAEIVRRVCAAGFDLLDAPPVVLGGKSLPIPFNAELEKSCYPQAVDIAAAIVELAEHII